MTDSELLLSALNTIQDFVLLLGEDLSVRWANKAYRDVFPARQGASQPEWLETFSSEAGQRALLLKQSLRQGASGELEVEQKSASGLRLVRYTLTRGGGRIAFVAAGRALSQRPAADAATPPPARPVPLEADPRSGLPTRAAFLQHVGEALLARSQGAQEFSCYLAEVDRYDELLARYGQEDAERLLNLVGQRLKAATRNNDLVARYNEKNFAIFVHNAPAALSMVVADRLRRAASQPSSQSGSSISLTISLGVASSDGGDFQSPDDLLSGCAQALSEAQGRGGNAAVAYSAPAKEEEHASALDTLFEES